MMAMEVILVALQESREDFATISVTLQMKEGA